MKSYVLRPSSGQALPVDFDAELNPQQREVVRAPEGQALVIAGAGSGKTRTLTYRVAHLVASGVPPESILLVTFTNKAAREMLRRVEQTLQSDLRGLVGGTFHHVGNLFLRKYAAAAGYSDRFTILDREDAADLMGEIASRRGAFAGEKKAPKGDVLLELHSLQLNTGRGLGDLLGSQFPGLMPYEPEFSSLFRTYTERKRELNVMDFDDLLVHWRHVLKSHPDALTAARARFRHVLVDEYQDTNRLQADIVEMIAGPEGNLMVVGDDAQSIYSFRGADFGNIIDFPKRFPKCRIYRLETNYRSRPEILALANSSIRHNARRFDKTLRSTRPSGGKPELVHTSSAGDQAAFVAQRIEEVREEGMEYADIAILYRAHWHSMELQMELTRRAIPFQVRSGLRFFEQAHIKDVAAYLRIGTNPRDEMSWKRILRLYPRIGRATADKIHAAIAAQSDPLASLGSETVLKAVPSAARAGWKDLCGVIRTLSEPKARQSPAEMIRLVLESGYEAHLSATYPNATGRVEDIRRLADYAIRYDNVDAFLAELALTSNVAGQGMDADEEAGDAVVLTTVHQAKGLEWGAVFVLWLTEGKFPDARSIREQGGEEEERRVFYVAITRAKDALFLLCPMLADERGVPDVIQKPSRFVEELDLTTFDEFRTGY